MPFPFRPIVVVDSVSLIALVFLWGYGCSTGLREPTTGTTVDLDGAGSWSVINPGTADETARRIADATVEPITRIGIDGDRATALAESLYVVLGATFSGRFDEYYEWMRNHGAELDELAEGFASFDGVDQRYGEDPGFPGADASVRERVEYLWEHVDQRDMRWTRVDVSSLRTGRNLTAQIGVDWQFPGIYAQRSLFRPRNGRLHDRDAKDVEANHRSAWVQFRAEFADGTKTDVRYVFYFDDGDKHWVPLAVLLGNNGPSRPLPML